MRQENETKTSPNKKGRSHIKKPSNQNAKENALKNNKAIESTTTSAKTTIENQKKGVLNQSEHLNTKDAIETQKSQNTQSIRESHKAIENTKGACKNDKNIKPQNTQKSNHTLKNTQEHDFIAGQKNMSILNDSTKEDNYFQSFCGLVGKKKKSLSISYSKKEGVERVSAFFNHARYQNTTNNPATIYECLYYCDYEIEITPNSLKFILTNEQTKECLLKTLTNESKEVIDNLKKDNGLIFNAQKGGVQ
ncbi:hypothetical protein [Helicobacter cetorum]|uniref:hypothetical protein n=1 Tax=Helicobacter cetorum TaxID=138563 RepID=UPI000CF10C30|nr:hypothetical protein [Helicobacter cetorum]